MTVHAKSDVQRITVNAICPNLRKVSIGLACLLFAYVVRRDTILLYPLGEDILVL